MSHTRHTAPYRLRLRSDRWAYVSHHHPDGECTLDLAGGWCDYRLPWWIERQLYYGNVPRWYITSTWTKPERQRERIDLRQMSKLVNGSGLETLDDCDELDFPNPQSRHGARWNFW